MTPKRFHTLKACLLRRQLNLTVVMDKIHKSRNFAAIVRNCDAVGIHEVHAVTESGELPKHHMTSAGAHKWISVRKYRDVETPLSDLRKQGFQLLAAHVGANSVDFREVDYTQPTAIIMGSELYGISESTALMVDKCVKIPMQGLVESFNVSVAAALILYEAQRQRDAAGLYQIPQISDTELSNTLFKWCYPQITDYCQRHQLPYPELDEDGFIVGKLADKDSTLQSS
jgi:tRNA (guanosine-2'-O-)-methyltransferase